MTQPLMYARQGPPDVRDLYAARLVGEGTATQGEVDAGPPSSTSPRHRFDSGKSYHVRQGRLADGSGRP